MPLFSCQYGYMYYFTRIFVNIEEEGSMNMLDQAVIWTSEKKKFENTESMRLILTCKF